MLLGNENCGLSLIYQNCHTIPTRLCPLLTFKEIRSDSVISNSYALKKSNVKNTA